MKEEYRELLRRENKFLMENISFDKYLLTILERECVIERIERKRIKAEEVDEDGIQKLLDYLVKKDDSAFLSFCAALDEDGQKHIATQLGYHEHTTNTGGKPDELSDEVSAALAALENLRITGDEATLQKWEQALRRKRCKLIENIQPSTIFFNKLQDLKVLNKGSRDTITVKPTDYEKISALLDYMHRRPRKDLISLQEALLYDNQEKAAQIFNE